MVRYFRRLRNQRAVRRIINRRQRSEGVRIPRALRGVFTEQLSRVPPERFGKRRRKATRKFAVMQQNAERYGSGWLPMHRMFNSVQELFRWVGARPPEQIVEEKVRALHGSRKCVVLDLGSGIGAALGTMMIDKRIEPIHQKIEFHGIDLLDIRNAPGLILHQGNLLTTPFPKSDLVFSQITTGYVGHIGFLIKKTAHSLYEKGVAVLHVNATGTAYSSDLPAPVLIKDMKKMEENLKKIKIPGYSIRITRGIFRTQDYFSRDDIGIVIEKQ